jgi:hypothetical protein
MYRLSILFLIFVTTLAVAKPVPALERFNIITTRELQQLLVKRDAGKTDFLLINALDRMIINAGAMPGSINIPISRCLQSYRKLGDDPTRQIIIYCQGYR